MTKTDELRPTVVAVVGTDNNNGRAGNALVDGVAVAVAVTGKVADAVTVVFAGFDTDARYNKRGGRR